MYVLTELKLRSLAFAKGAKVKGIKLLNGRILKLGRSKVTNLQLS